MRLQTENEMKRRREEKEEDGRSRNWEKRGRRHLEEEEMMRERRSRREWRVKEEDEERFSRSSPEMGSVERWRCGRREKERDSEFSGSEDDAARTRERKGDIVRMEKEERGSFERSGEKQRIGENKFERERFHNNLTLSIFSFLSHLSTVAGMKRWMRDWRECRGRRMKKRLDFLFLC